jgi:hypothetical protein
MRATRTRSRKPVDLTPMECLDDHDALGGSTRKGWTWSLLSAAIVEQERRAIHWAGESPLVSGQAPRPLASFPCAY